jgi:GTP-binding protein of the ras superfamily involved in termination of M-phase
MDPPPEQQQQHQVTPGSSSNIDDASMHTITASTLQNQNPTYDARPQTSYSDTGFSRAYSQSADNTPDRDSRPPSASAQGSQYGDSRSKAEKNSSVVIKVGMVGDAQIGKTSLMVKYVEGSWDEDYIQTLGKEVWGVFSRLQGTNICAGVNFMEKTISIRNTEITFSIWDLGGQREFVNMLPLVCNDAVAILFMFDLTRKSTLNSIKEWYRQGRGFNKTAIPFLVGTKYDHFVNFPKEEQEEISLQAKRFAKAMKASLIFSSTSHSINVQKVTNPARITHTSIPANAASDLQDRPFKSVRPALHDSGNRKRGRTAPALPIRWLRPETLSDTRRLIGTRTTGKTRNMSATKNWFCYKKGLSAEEKSLAHSPQETLIVVGKELRLYSMHATASLGRWLSAWGDSSREHRIFFGFETSNYGLGLGCSLTTAMHFCAASFLALLDLARVGFPVILS